jgi:steroid 5-alpha reductase family enzyme
MPLRPDLAGSRRYVAIVYLISIAAAFLGWELYEGPMHWRLLVGLGASTAVTFVAAVHADNGSVFDPWWSILPPFAALWLTGMSEAESLTPRQVAVHAVMWFWGIRLTINWIVGWPGLQHEDWRYVRLAEVWPTPKWVVRLLAVEGAPTIFVWLGCLPLYPALTMGDASFGWIDGLALFIGLGAVGLELAADEQMRIFARTKQRGDLMDQGLWGLSRHPNYLGEVSFWVSMWLFAVAAAPGEWWVVIGPITMIVLFVAGSIPLIEKRSRDRRPEWAGYESRVPALLPRIRARRD